MSPRTRPSGRPLHGDPSRCASDTLRPVLEWAHLNARPTDVRRTAMRRYRILLIFGHAAAATGCIYGREPTRDDRHIDAPPPPPVAEYSTDSGPSPYHNHQPEAPPPPAAS